jgi:hypothetical protein
MAAFAEQVTSIYHACRCCASLVYATKMTPFTSQTQQDATFEQSVVAPGRLIHNLCSWTSKCLPRHPTTGTVVLTSQRLSVSLALVADAAG